MFLRLSVECAPSEHARFAGRAFEGGAPFVVVRGPPEHPLFPVFVPEPRGAPRRWWGGELQCGVPHDRSPGRHLPQGELLEAESGGVPREENGETAAAAKHWWNDPRSRVSQVRSALFVSLFVSTRTPQCKRHKGSGCYRWYV